MLRSHDASAISATACTVLPLAAVALAQIYRMIFHLSVNAVAEAASLQKSVSVIISAIHEAVYTKV